jgi:hypothetical protein
MHGEKEFALQKTVTRQALLFGSNRYTIRASYY